MYLLEGKRKRIPCAPRRRGAEFPLHAHTNPWSGNLFLNQRLRLTKSELRNLNFGNSPGNTTVIRRHLASNTLTLTHSLVVVGVRRVQCNGSVDPLVRANSTAVLLGTFDRAAPALGMAVVGRQRRDLAAVDGDNLSVVAACIVKLVCVIALACVRSAWVLIFCSQCMVILSPSCAFSPSD